MSAELALPGKLVNRILAHARQHEHIECCGLVSAAGGSPAHYYAIRNIAANPADRFEMDPKQQIAAMKHMREHGEELLAIVHSHPRSPPIPSASDVQHVGYPDAYYIIVSLANRDLPDIRAFARTEGEMRPVALRYDHQG